MVSLSFLEFLKELDKDERISVFQLMLTKRAGVRPSRIEDPFEYFNVLLAVRLRHSPFIDEGIKLLDMICGELAQWWAETQHGKQ